MPFLLDTIGLVFGLIAIGYGAGLTRYLPATVGSALTQFSVGVALPLLLFRTITQADFLGAAPWSFWGAYFASAALAWTTGHLLTTRVFGREGATGVVGGVSAAFSNLVLLGIPFILGVYGRPGFEILSLLVSVHLPVMILVSIVQFRIFSAAGAEKSATSVATAFLRQIATNPLIVAILAGWAWRLAGLEMPGLAARLIDALANVAGPVALFAIGLGLREFGISGHVRPALALALVKLVLMPAVALAMALALDLPPLTATIAVMAAALPSGFNSYLIATQFGTGQGLASNSMTIATALAVLTTAFWLTVTAAIFA